ncbi:MAG: TolC family protein [Planctomycetota bacterium]
MRPTHLWLGVTLVAAGCSTAWYAQDADREVNALLRERTQDVLGDRESHLLRPEPAPETAPAAAPEPPAEGAPPEAAQAPPAEEPPRPIGLTEALATVFEFNREYLTRKESLYQQGLGLTLTRYNYGPLFAAAVSYLWADTEDGPRSNTISGTLSGSQILPTGGSLSLDSGVSTTREQGLDLDGFGDAGGGRSYGSSVGLNLSQPLLRGGGYEVSHEALTQAERSLVYAIRDFELYREDLTISVARQFFALVSQKQVLANQEENYDAAVFDRQKAESFFDLGRNTQEEVFRARRREVDAEDSVIDGRAQYDRALDEFKILLGLPIEARIEIVHEEPPFEAVRIDGESAITVALHNRLDVITEREQLEDVERSVRLAENSLLPDLDLALGYDFAGADDTFKGAAPDVWAASAGLSLTLPLQRKAERNSYRSSLIALEQARRNHVLFIDRIGLDIRDQLRQLESIEKRIGLQEEQIKQEERAVEVTRLRYESGDLDNRDLLEARQGLTDAMNSLINLKVDHFIARLTLLRDLGLLFVDDKGMWRS